MNVFSRIGQLARRHTLFIKDRRTGNRIFLWGVVEILEPDMQDYVLGTPEDKYFEIEDDGSPFTVCWIAEFVNIEEGFVRNPTANYVIGDSHIKILGENWVLEPNEACALLLMMDELERNNLHVVLPRRNCTGFLNVWIDKDRKTETFVQEKKSLQKRISKVTLNELGYDMCLYPNHYGNLYMLTYHPVFRTVDLTCSPDPMGLFVRFNHRRRSDGELFVIRIEDYHHQGLCIGERTFNVDGDDRLVFLDLPSEPNNLTISISDAEGNMVYRREGIRFIKSISVNIGTHNEEHTSQKRMPRVENFFGVEAKRLSKSGEQGGNMIFLSGRVKDYEKTMNDAHRWFTEVLLSAREKCYILDPFFGAEDFVTFVSPVADVTANINILISESALDKAEAMLLMRVILDYNEQKGGKQIVRCRVSSKKHALHSKMVATESAIWMFAESFRNFGKSPMSITKMPDEQVKSAKTRIEQMWLNGEQTIKLEDYVNG